MKRRTTDNRPGSRSLARRHRGERGAAAVEFALCVPVLFLILFGIIDFGLVFAGRYTAENGVDTAARTASLSLLSSSTLTSGCSGGPDNYTANMVCAVVADIGSPTGTSGGVSQVGICFATPGVSVSCSGTPSPTKGTAGQYDVEVCASINASSTTGISASYLNNKVEVVSSRLLIESGPNNTPGTATPYSYFNSGSTAVTYNSKSITGMNCT